MCMTARFAPITTGAIMRGVLSSSTGVRRMRIFLPVPGPGMNFASLAPKFPVENEDTQTTPRILVLDALHTGAKAVKGIIGMKETRAFWRKSKMAFVLFAPSKLGSV